VGEVYSAFNLLYIVQLGRRLIDASDRDSSHNQDPMVGPISLGPTMGKGDIILPIKMLRIGVIGECIPHSIGFRVSGKK